jgi:hypothetical protein
VAVDHDEPAGVDRLYEMDPSGFVEARDALARELRAEDRDAARRVEQLRKPTLAAWALNRAAREHPDDVEDLAEAGRDVQAAQEAAVAGDDPGALRSVTDRRRSVVRRLADVAVEEVGENHRDEIEATLEAASIDADVASTLRRGRLTKAQPRPSGFGALGAIGATAAGTGAGQPAKRRDRATRKRLQRRLRRAKEAVERSETRLERAERRMREAQERVEEAEAALERDVDARDELQDALDDVG